MKNTKKILIFLSAIAVLTATVFSVVSTALVAGEGTTVDEYTGMSISASHGFEDGKASLFGGVANGGSTGSGVQTINNAIPGVSPIYYPDEESLKYYAINYDNNTSIADLYIQPKLGVLDNAERTPENGFVTEFDIAFFSPVETVMQQSRDEDGNLLWKTTAVTVTEVDEYGDPILDEKGNEIKKEIVINKGDLDYDGIMDADEEWEPITEIVKEPLMVPVYDDEGNPVYVQATDDEGNPLYTTDAEGKQIPVWETDEDGNPIQKTTEKLDANGEVIMVDKVIKGDFTGLGSTSFTVGMYNTYTYKDGYVALLSFATNASSKAVTITALNNILTTNILGTKTFTFNADEWCHITIHFDAETKYTYVYVGTDESVFTDSNGNEYVGRVCISQSKTTVAIENQGGAVGQVYPLQLRLGCKATSGVVGFDNFIAYQGKTVHNPGYLNDLPSYQKYIYMAESLQAGYLESSPSLTLYSGEFTYTASTSGVFSFTAPSGLSLVNAATGEAYSRYYNYKETTFDIELQEGESVRFIATAASYNQNGWSISVTDGDAITVNVETALKSGNTSYTAPAAGAYTLTIPAGLEVVNVATGDAYSSYYAETDTSVTLRLGAGETLSLALASLSSETAFNIEVAVSGNTAEALEITTADTVYYSRSTYTAKSEGDYTFKVPAGFGIMDTATNEIYSVCYGTEGSSFTVHLESGEKRIFVISGLIEQTPCVISVSGDGVETAVNRYQAYTYLRTDEEMILVGKGGYYGAGVSTVDVSSADKSAVSSAISIYTKFYNDQVDNSTSGVYDLLLAEVKAENVASYIAYVDDFTSTERTLDNAEEREIKVKTINNFLTSAGSLMDGSSVDYIRAVNRFETAKSYIESDKAARSFIDLMQIFDNSVEYGASVSRLKSHYENAMAYYVQIPDVYRDSESAAYTGLSADARAELDAAFASYDVGGGIIGEQTLEVNSVRFITIVNLMKQKSCGIWENDGAEVRKLWERALDILIDGSYDPDYEGFADAKVVFDLANKNFWAVLQSEHVAVISAKLDGYNDSSVSYIQKASICTYVDRYLAENDSYIDYSDAAVQKQVARNEAYKAQLETLVGDYSKLLLQNTTSFINTMKRSAEYSTYDMLKPIFEEASEYYYTMNVTGDDIDYYIEEYGKLARLLSAIESDCESYIAIVNGTLTNAAAEAIYKPLSELTAEEELYRSLVACYLCTENLDMTYSGVIEAKAIYDAKYQEYNTAIDGVNSQIDNSESLVYTVRGNWDIDGIVAFVKNLLNR